MPCILLLLPPQLTVQLMGRLAQTRESVARGLRSDTGPARDSILTTVADGSPARMYISVGSILPARRRPV
jgi:hypothetical protein